MILSVVTEGASSGASGDANLVDYSLTDGGEHVKRNSLSTHFAHQILINELFSASRSCRRRNQCIWHIDFAKTIQDGRIAFLGV
jgi:hypothetical protein